MNIRSTIKGLFSVAILAGASAYGYADTTSMSQADKTALYRSVGDHKQLEQSTESRDVGNVADQATSAVARVRVGL